MDNHSIISRRFKNLRESKKDSHGKELPMSQLAEILCNEKFIENYTSEAIRQEIRKVEQKNKFPQLFLIKAYSNYFNVTADYLLGIRDNAVVDEDFAMIGRVTGLSDDAIRVFKEMSKEELTTFNNLAAVDNLLHLLLTSLWSYANNSTFVDIEITNNITESKNKITDKNEIESIMKFQAIDTFNIVLHFIKESFRNSVSQAADNKLNLLKANLKTHELEEQLKDAR